MQNGNMLSGEKRGFDCVAPILFCLCICIYSRSDLSDCIVFILHLTLSLPIELHSCILYAPIFSWPARATSSIPSTSFSGALRKGEWDESMWKVVMSEPIPLEIPSCTAKGMPLSWSQKIYEHGCGESVSNKFSFWVYVLWTTRERHVSKQDTFKRLVLTMSLYGSYVTFPEKTEVAECDNLSAQVCCSAGDKSW